MHIDIPNIIVKLKQLKLKELAYPMAMTVFLIVVIFTLVSAARFLSLNINKAFGVAQTASESLQIDTTNYELVAKKLGIVKSPIPVPEQVVPVNTVPATTTPLATTTPAKK